MKAIQTRYLGPTNYRVHDIAAAHGGDYLHAARIEADIADQLEGLGDPYFDRLSRHYRAVSLALLAHHLTHKEPTK